MTVGLLRGCLVVQPQLGGDVLNALRASPQEWRSAWRRLRDRMRAAGYDPKDISRMRQGLRNSRFVAELELATVQGLDEASRLLLEAIDTDGWNKIMGYARARVPGFGRANARVSSIASLKGIIAEELFYSSEKFQALMARARARAARLGYPPENVRFMRGTRGVTLSEIDANFVNHGELTDGLIVVTRDAQLDDDLLALRRSQRQGREFERNQRWQGEVSPENEDMHILAVMESKSPSNVEAVAADHGENWLGQVDMDIERFDNLPCLVNGRWYSEAQVTISRYRTEWAVIVPKGYDFPDELKRRLGILRPVSPSDAPPSAWRSRLLKVYSQDIDNDLLNRVAERILETLSG